MQRTWEKEAKQTAYAKVRLVHLVNRRKAGSRFRKGKVVWNEVGEVGKEPVQAAKALQTVVAGLNFILECQWEANGLL